MEHHFDIDDAQKYGVHKAVVLYNIRFWVRHNMANNKNLHDDRTWTYNSAKAYAVLFPYLNTRHISRMLKELTTPVNEVAWKTKTATKMGDGVLVKGNYNNVKYDRKGWYAFVDESEIRKSLECPDKPCGDDIDPLANMPNGLANMPNGNTENSPTIADSKPDTKPDNSDKWEDRKQIPPKPESITKYAKSISFTLDGEAFCDYYQSQGWKKANGQKLVDWQCAVRQWKKKHLEKHPEEIKKEMMTEEQWLAEEVPKFAHLRQAPTEVAEA